MLIEQRISIEAKSTGVAYALWFFLDRFGTHRFYLGKTGSEIAILILKIMGCLTLFFVVGIFLLIAVGIWLLVDAFLIPGMIRDDIAVLPNRMIRDMQAFSSETTAPAKA